MGNGAAMHVEASNPMPAPVFGLTPALVSTAGFAFALAADFALGLPVALEFPTLGVRPSAWCNCVCTVHLFIPRPRAHPAVCCRWQKYFGKWATLTFQTNVFCLLYSFLCCASGESSWHPEACIPRVVCLYPDAQTNAPTQHCSRIFACASSGFVGGAAISALFHGW